MQYAIFLNTILPVRSEAKESSEMVTQLLFGETCTILGEESSFLKIQNSFDNYQGWVDEKMLTKISEDVYSELNKSPIFRINTPIADLFCLTDRSIYRLSLGSRLPFFDHETNQFEIAGKTFQIHPSFVTYISTSCKENIVQTAMLFLNTPYLWGGKNIFGIDCSGLVQIVYSLNGFTLPRDASIQATEGKTIDSIENAQKGDLIFFEKNKKIIHVGIYLSENKIIHASGKVRIDKIDEKGIYNDEISGYTHRLSCIKSI